jgi:hypothetical protein
MDVSMILAELKAEREQIDEAVLSLERLARGRGRGPGRPPNWMADVAPPKQPGRRPAKRRGGPPDGSGSAPPLPPCCAMLLPGSRCQIQWAGASGGEDEDGGSDRNPFSLFGRD